MSQGNHSSVPAKHRTPLYLHLHERPWLGGGSGGPGYDRSPERSGSKDCESALLLGVDRLFLTASAVSNLQHRQNHGRQKLRGKIVYEKKPENFWLAKIKGKIEGKSWQFFSYKKDFSGKKVTQRHAWSKWTSGEFL